MSYIASYMARGSANSHIKAAFVELFFIRKFSGWNSGASGSLPLYGLYRRAPFFEGLKFREWEVRGNHFYESTPVGVFSSVCNPCHDRISANFR